MNVDETSQRIRWGIVATLVGVALFFLLLDSLGNSDAVFAFLRNPLSSALGWTAARTDAFANALGGPRELQAARERINQLEAENALLVRENAELLEFRNQNQIYVELFGRAAEAPELERLQANVIGRDTSPIFRSIVIDKGSDDGVFVGMPVEAARGLVGQVYRTSPDAAQVLLITDNISAISARLSSSRALGVVEGGGLGGSMTLDWVDLEANIQVGDVVLTSGLNGKFPSDLVIGRVIEVDRSEAELFQRALLQPSVNFEDLEVVFVITGFERVDTSVFDEPPETIPELP